MEGPAMIKILYEDNHLLVAVKPKGILSQADGSKKEDMLTILKVYLKEKYQKPGNVYLGLVHRLDINTSGVIVFAKTSKAAARLSKQIQEHTFKKKYHAIVEGRLEGGSTLEAYVLKNEIEKKSYIDAKGLYASLTYQVLETKELKGGFVSFVDIELKTGRFHQIRAQFSHIGHPIYGDKKYGSRYTIEATEFPLDAYRIEFQHPISKKIMIFQQESLHL